MVWEILYVNVDILLYFQKPFLISQSVRPNHNDGAQMYSHAHCSLKHSHKWFEHDDSAKFWAGTKTNDFQSKILKSVRKQICSNKGNRWSQISFLILWWKPQRISSQVGIVETRILISLMNTESLVLLVSTSSIWQPCECSFYCSKYDSIYLVISGWTHSSNNKTPKFILIGMSWRVSSVKL